MIGFCIACVGCLWLSSLDHGPGSACAKTVFTCPESLLATIFFGSVGWVIQTVLF